MKLIFLSVILSAGLYAQTTVNVPSLTVSADGQAAIQAWMLGQTSGFTTTLVGAIDGAVLSLKVSDATGLGNGDEVLIDGEAFALSGKSGKTFVCTRADLGTVAATHADGATVTRLKYASIKALFRQLIIDTVGQIMEQASYPTGTTQNTIINSAKAAKQAAKTGAVQ